MKKEISREKMELERDREGFFCWWVAKKDVIYGKLTMNFHCLIRLDKMTMNVAKGKIVIR